MQAPLSAAQGFSPTRASDPFHAKKGAGGSDPFAAPATDPFSTGGGIMGKNTGLLVGTVTWFKKKKKFGF